MQLYKKKADRIFTRFNFHFCTLNGTSLFSLSCLNAEYYKAQLILYKCGTKYEKTILLLYNNNNFYNNI